MTYVITGSCVDLMDRGCVPELGPVAVDTPLVAALPRGGDTP